MQIYVGQSSDLTVASPIKNRDAFITRLWSADITVYFRCLSIPHTSSCYLVTCHSLRFLTVIIRQLLCFVNKLQERGSRTFVPYVSILLKEVTTSGIILTSGVFLY